MTEAPPASDTVTTTYVTQFWSPRYDAWQDAPDETPAALLTDPELARALLRALRAAEDLLEARSLNPRVPKIYWRLVRRTEEVLE